MLIPKFELSQSDSKLIITIYAPYADINNTDVYFEDNDFRFISNPYYLHLNLPGKLMDMGQASAQYLCDGDKFIFAVHKAVQGEHFQDLDMISLFIVKKKSNTFRPRIEPLDSEGTSDYSLSDVSDEENIIDLNEEEEDLQAEGACALQPLVVVKPKYGFGNRFSNVFLGFTHEIRELCDLPDPDGTPTSARRQLKMKKELKDFREEHYLADFFQKEVTDLVIKYKALWQRQNFEAPASLTTKEFDKLKEIPLHAWSAEKRTFIYLGLVDILLAFCYDNRTTEGDPTSESAWTINKLSSTLSWFVKFKTVESVLKSFMRRSLCYPLFRSWDLSLKVVADVESLLRCNKLYIQKCLLQIHTLFNASEPRYMLNRIYMDDYCQWIAYAKPKDLQLIADDIAKIKLHKNDVGLNLVALEEAAQLELEERTDEAAAAILPPDPSVSSMDELAECVEKMTITDIRKNHKPPSNDSDMDLDSDDLSNSENGEDTSECSDDGPEADDEESLDSDDSHKNTNARSMITTLDNHFLYSKTQNAFCHIDTVLETMLGCHQSAESSAKALNSKIFHINMLIPKFELSQSDSKLIITIYAPYVDINNTEIYYKDNDFRFISNPYYLHLNLPGKLMVMEQPSAQYLCDGHKFIFAVDKAVQGDHFQDLDMISLFIVKKKTYTFCPRIEPLDSEGTSDYSLSDVSDEENIIDLNEEEEDLQAEGACALQPVVVVKPKYGFGNRFSNVFLGFTHKIRKLCDLPDPDGTPTSARRQLKMEKELKDFREENYLANFFQKEVTDLVIKYKALWQRQNFEATASLTTKEFNKLKEIPRHAWSAEKHTFIYLGLIDILLAFCYDNRITEGDPTSESAWTINKLSSTLSWFEKFETVESVLISFMRRSLCYPLFRSWDLSLKVVADVESLLRCNKLYIQKCLLQIHSLFNASEPHYMLNRIYMDDYCQWIAYAKPKDLQSIADDIAKIKLHKNDVGLNLVALEGAAQLELEKRTDQTAATVLPPYPSVSSMDELAACLEKLTIADIRKDDKPPSNDSDMDFDNDELSNIENGQDTSECSEGGFEADDEESPDSDDSNKILILIYDGTADIPQPDLNEGASHNALYRYWSV